RRQPHSRPCVEGVGGAVIDSAFQAYRRWDAVKQVASNPIPAPAALGCQMVDHAIASVRAACRGVVFDKAAHYPVDFANVQQPLAGTLSQLIPTHETEFAFVRTGDAVTGGNVGRRGFANAEASE